MRVVLIPTPWGLGGVRRADTTTVVPTTFTSATQILKDVRTVLLKTCTTGAFDSLMRLLLPECRCPVDPAADV
jgi:hypothetical protein